MAKNQVRTNFLNENLKVVKDMGTKICFSHFHGEYNGEEYVEYTPDWSHCDKKALSEFWKLVKRTKPFCDHIHRRKGTKSTFYIEIKETPYFYVFACLTLLRYPDETPFIVEEFAKSKDKSWADFIDAHRKHINGGKYNAGHGFYDSSIHSGVGIVLIKTEDLPHPSEVVSSNMGTLKDGKYWTSLNDSFLGTFIK